jgi:hypothetical protein
MTDDFLERFEAQRAARLAAERSFQLAGETLTFKPSVREKYANQLAEGQRRIQAYEADNSVGLTTDDLDLDIDGLILAADEQILNCLEPDGQAAWGRLRALDAAEPLTFQEIGQIADYLLGRVTGIPTDAPAGSSAGRTTTAKPSKAASSSKAKA